MNRQQIKDSILEILGRSHTPVTALSIAKELNLTKTQVNSAFGNELKLLVDVDRTDNPPKFSLIVNDKVATKQSYSHLSTITLIDTDTISDYSGVGIYFATQELDFDVDCDVIQCEDIMMAMSWHIHSLLGSTGNITIRTTNPQAKALANIVNTNTKVKVAVTK